MPKGVYLLNIPQINSNIDEPLSYRALKDMLFSTLLKHFTRQVVMKEGLSFKRNSGAASVGK